MAGELLLTEALSSSPRPPQQGAEIPSLTSWAFVYITQTAHPTPTPTVHKPPHTQNIVSRQLGRPK